jgi:hypothetical protein
VERLIFTKACLCNFSVIMVIMHATLIELLYQVMMGWIPALEYLLPGVCRACGHVLLYQVVNAATS